MIAGLMLPTARADDGAISNVSGTVRLMSEHPSIRMVAETVYARVSMDSAEVDCLFVLENRGQADTVLIGFPDQSYGADTGVSQMPSFRSWVDGEEVACTFVSASPDDPGDVARSWWTKRVPFASDQVRLIRDHYVARVGRATVGGRWFEYILGTGASWAGTIGVADVTMDLEGIPLEDVTVNPPAIVDGSRLCWRLRDFEPDVRLHPETPDVLTVGWNNPVELQELQRLHEGQQKSK